MIPLQLVLDTNVIGSAALKPDGLPRTVLMLAMTRPPNFMRAREYSLNIGRSSRVQSSESGKACGGNFFS
jgi:predicted nucleic acid-binding protein